MAKPIWTVTYLDDEFADEVGSRVFTNSDDAERWAEDYVGDQAGVEGDTRTRFARVERHEI